MAKAGWKVGDVVRLKGGGPDMTVIGVQTSTLGELVGCAWFANHGDGLWLGMPAMRETFYATALESAK